MSDIGPQGGKVSVPVMRVYGYGIVDRNGAPWWNESCICQDREPMADICENMNDRHNGSPADARRPYRVVRLFRLTTAKGKRK